MNPRDNGEVVAEHPQKVQIGNVISDQSLSPEDGWVNMDVQWIVTHATVGSRQTVFGITTFPPGARHDIHNHPHAEEVEYLIEGSGIARIGDANVAVQAGEVVFVAENEAHGFWNTSETDRAVMIWCYGGAASLDDAGYVTRPDAQWPEQIGRIEDGDSYVRD
jgi:quercetin dioxygenase-like cupin family protein